MTHALYDPKASKIDPIILPAVGFEALKDGTFLYNSGLHTLAKLRPEKHRAYAPTVEDAKAGRYIVPVIDLPAPDPGAFDSLEYTDAYDADTDSVVRTWKVKTATRLELRRLLFYEGRDLLQRSNWTQTADYVEHHEIKARRWNVWRQGVRTTVKALKAGTQEPRDVVWAEPPEPLEDTIQ